MDWFEHAQSKHSRLEGRSRRPAKHPQPSEEATDSSYRDICRSVVEWYDNFHVPCEFEIPQPMRWVKHAQCVQRRNNHGNIHRAPGFLAASDYQGGYESSFDRTRYAWELRVLKHMNILEHHHQWQDPNNPRLARAKAHQQSMRRLYDQLDVKNFFLNSACLCCLANAPEHELQCGHVLCTECVMDFGKTISRTQVVLDKCPLHDDASSSNGPLQSNVVHLPPPLSGLRILVLDG